MQPGRREGGDDCYLPLSLEECGMHRAWDPCQELPTVTQGAAELGTCTLCGPCPEHLGLWHQKAAPASVPSLIPPPGPFLFPFAPHRPPSEHRSSVSPFKGGGVYCHRGCWRKGCVGHGGRTISASSWSHSCQVPFTWAYSARTRWQLCFTGQGLLAFPRCLS